MKRAWAPIADFFLAVGVLFMITSQGESDSISLLPMNVSRTEQASAAGAPQVRETLLVEVRWTEGRADYRLHKSGKEIARFSGIDGLQRRLKREQPQKISIRADRQADSGAVDDAMLAANRVAGRVDRVFKRDAVNASDG